jgi:hypothetical protein
MLVFLQESAGVSIYLTLRVNKSLERLKSDLQQDVFKFSKWHERRVEAVIVIYQAFETYLDFLRKHLYWDWKGKEEQAGPIDQIHDFPRAIQRQIMFLDDELAETVLQFQAELQAVWNDVVGNNKMASEETRKRLDYEIPAYLPRLRRAINQSMCHSSKADECHIDAIHETRRRPATVMKISGRAH